MLIAIFAWLLTAGICVLFLRRAVFNFGDPVIFEGVAIPFSAALLTVLCVTDLVPYDKLGMFAAILVGFLAGARIAVAFTSREQLRSNIISTIGRFSKGEIYFVLTLTMIITAVFFGLAVANGGVGDGRAEFMRAFRPLATLRTGLFFFSLLLLLSPKLSGRQVTMWVVALVGLTIACAGKGVFVPFFYWVGLRFFVNKRKAKLRQIAQLGFLVLLGAAIMEVIAYDAKNVSSTIAMIANRFWMYGDVYIYAYKLDAMSVIRGNYDVSFLSYMLHPITSLVGIRGYEKPLGSMLMSAVLQSDVLTGPNPQLPVLMDFFFPDQLYFSIPISFTIGLLVFLTRVLGVILAGGRSRYLALGGITVAIFCPGAGFVDTSQVLILMISLFFVSLAGATLEMFAATRSPPASSMGQVF